MVKSIFKDVKQLKEQFASAPLSNEQMQKLLRTLHDALVAGKHRYAQYLLILTLHVSSFQLNQYFTVT